MLKPQVLEPEIQDDLPFSLFRVKKKNTPIDVIEGDVNSQDISSDEMEDGDEEEEAPPVTFQELANE